MRKKPFNVQQWNLKAYGTCDSPDFDKVTWKGWTPDLVELRLEGFEVIDQPKHNVVRRAEDDYGGLADDQIMKLKNPEPIESNYPKPSTVHVKAKKLSTDAEREASRQRILSYTEEAKKLSYIILIILITK